MKKERLSKYLSFLTLGAVAFVLAGCSPAENAQTSQSTVNPATTTIAVTATSNPPATTAVAPQSRVVLAEMFTSEG